MLLYLFKSVYLYNYLAFTLGNHLESASVGTYRVCSPLGVTKSREGTILLVTVTILMMSQLYACHMKHCTVRLTVEASL